MASLRNSYSHHKNMCALLRFSNISYTCTLDTDGSNHLFTQMQQHSDMLIEQPYHSSYHSSQLTAHPVIPNPYKEIIASYQSLKRKDTIRTVPQTSSLHLPTENKPIRSDNAASCRAIKIPFPCYLMQMQEIWT